MSKPLREFSPQELEQIKTMAGIGLPWKHIAVIMKVSPDHFEELVKRNDALRGAIEEGESTALAGAHQTAYSMAMGKAADPRTGAAEVAPSERMLMFWLKTRAGWRETTRLELTGADGQPLNTIGELTPEQREKEIERLIKLRERTKDAAAVTKRITKKDPQRSES